MLRPEPWVLAAAVAISAALAVIVLFQALNGFRVWRLRRDALGTLQGRDRPGQEDALVQASVVRVRGRPEGSLMAGLADRIPPLWDLHHLLVQSGVKWTMEGFVARTGAASAAAGVLALALFNSQSVTGVAFVLGGMSPFLYVRRKKRRRLKQLETQLPVAIDLIARAVRAGHPLSAALGMAADEAPEPLASEFRVTFEEQKFGLPFEEALLSLADRLEVVDVKIFVTAILVQREVGGNLAEILETIAETMRARFNLKRQVRVYTAQGRMSGYTLAALPILVGLAITLINPDYMQMLFYESLGRGMLAGAGMLQVIGFLWIRKIVDVRY